jgi:DNA-binding response OmpR family regulator
MEWRVLEVLAANAGWVVPHERLLARAWGREDPADIDSLRVIVRRLRAKLGDDVARPRYIETVRGLGYRLIAARDGLSPGPTSRASGSA